MAIPIIDIFAGPGGLGEGFSAVENAKGVPEFKIVLSIEKDKSAHTTLTLRSFFRQFNKDQVPEDYYDFVRGKITLNDLYAKWPIQAKAASEEAWLATLGSKKRATPHTEVDQRIRKALNGQKDWLLIGGPPCQAYSVIGRVRKKRKTLNEKKDERVGLYKQYLRILAIHNPAVFVMENVRGLLTAKTKTSPVFEKMLEDLSNPVAAYKVDFIQNGQQLICPGYEIYSLVKKKQKKQDNSNKELRPKDYLIKSENYGIPQTRHRVILLGIRKDLLTTPKVLEKQKDIPISEVISGLPKLRSKLSRSKDDGIKWKKIVCELIENNQLNDCDESVLEQINKQINQITLPKIGIGREFISTENDKIGHKPTWFLDHRLGGICNHVARSHMKGDLHRYFFVSCFGRTKKRSPTLSDFPVSLLPAHKNVQNADGEITRKFADRFKVQLKGKPSKTITSHISQDGHYYIHYDPTQCRSLTVREAARIQTFPDNYFFCGPRTSQFIQVGNAVPPLLANQIACIVISIFNEQSEGKKITATRRTLHPIG